MLILLNNFIPSRYTAGMIEEKAKTGFYEKVKGRSLKEQGIEAIED